MSFQVANRTFQTVDDTEKLLIYAATQYDKTRYAEDFDGVEITDPEYDELYSYVKERKPNSKAFEGTSPSEAAVSGDIVVHDPPMTSIEKADGDYDKKVKKYEDWIKTCATRLGVSENDIRKDIVQSYKRDGIALRVNYVNGKLISAGLRPRDGINGTDVTKHVKYIKGVPLKLAMPLTLSLNGEIECWLDDFKLVNAAQDEAGDEPYANPRNYTAGRLGRDDPEENKNSRIRITFYSITGFDDYQKYYKTEIERAIWANTDKGLNLRDEDGNGFFVQVRRHHFDNLAKMEDDAPKLPYYTDGIVLKINNLEWQEELGHHGGDPVKEPHGALAWKFKEPEIEAVNDHLEWNASRTGRVVPTSIFKESVNLADTDVSKATCNNYGWALKMGIGPGTVIKVKKAGKIIPNVCGVVSGKCLAINAPTNCPTCKFPLEIVTSSSENMDLMCKNPDCGAKHIKSWIFFITKMGGKGLGSSAMEKILNTGKVKTLPDLYELTLESLVLGGFSDRQATLALATIYGLKAIKDNDKLLQQIENARAQKQKIEAWRFFSSFGIPGAGESAGKALMQHYKSFDKIREATKDELLEVAGIGEITANAIAEWFSKNNHVVDRLLKRVELELPKTGKLTGMNFVLTGAFSLGKKHWEKQIIDRGGNIQSSVGKTTGYLIQEHGKNDGSPSDKEQKAVKLGVPVISVSELEKML